MKCLTMKNEDGAERTVEIEDEIPVDYGGFGTVFTVLHQPQYLVKRVYLTPEPIGNVNRYIAHIKTTRQRLLAIKADEQKKLAPRHFIGRFIDEITQSLSTHWFFERDKSGLKVETVWFLQKRAPGKKLLDLFNDEAPSFWQRMQIAKDVIQRMRTLRRADLVHLDCVAQNIFVDLENQKTTVIDLDGCGVVRRTPRSLNDEWDYPPLTLGHLKVVRPPAWYPQIGVNCGPKAGNFLFAERWVVIDTIVRILSWNQVAALSWLAPDTRQPIVSAYSNIQKVIESASASHGHYPVEEWAKLYNRILDGLRREFAPLPPAYLTGTYPSCLLAFVDLLQEACLNARALGAEVAVPYETFRRMVK